MFACFIIFAQFSGDPYIDRQKGCKLTIFEIIIFDLLCLKCVLCVTIQSALLSLQMKIQTELYEILDYITHNKTNWNWIGDREQRYCKSNQGHTRPRWVTQGHKMPHKAIIGQYNPVLAINFKLIYGKDFCSDWHKTRQD